MHSPEKAKFIVTETIPEIFYEERRPITGNNRGFGFGATLNRHPDDHDRLSCDKDFREPDNPARDTMTAQWSVRFFFLRRKMSHGSRKELQHLSVTWPYGREHT